MSLEVPPDPHTGPGRPHLNPTLKPGSPAFQVAIPKLTVRDAPCTPLPGHRGYAERPRGYRGSRTIFVCVQISFHYSRSTASCLNDPGLITQLSSSISEILTLIRSPSSIMAPHETLDRDPDDIVQTNTLGTVRLRHVETKEIILIPTPSKDPNDPLNWYVGHTR
jgi:hypothetical protein